MLGMCHDHNTHLTMGENGTAALIAVQESLASVEAYS